MTCKTAAAHHQSQTLYDVSLFVFTTKAEASTKELPIRCSQQIANQTANKFFTIKGSSFELLRFFPLEWFNWIAKICAQFSFATTRSFMLLELDMLAIDSNSFCFCCDRLKFLIITENRFEKIYDRSNEFESQAVHSRSESAVTGEWWWTHVTVNKRESSSSSWLPL